ncbi:hypothetical protein M407DRAFT_23063 [Tulasnella calospora MUT 4182]|uniref:Uncharacterized protein n=1 Tax=Tulasnella calospora MUT 4182 TaxID=1051891 RepID=A0A0C3QBB5_9AGAM|nr:hypothetical protein M407DRAFT_23063 [Tulasnella calospora MUT 4182]
MLTAISALYDMVDQLDERLLEEDTNAVNRIPLTSAIETGRNVSNVNGASLGRDGGIIAPRAPANVRSGDNYLAVQDQLQVQLHHVLPRLLPSLHQVDALLNDIEMNQSVPNPDLEEFDGLLVQIHTKLQSKLGSRNDHSGPEANSDDYGMQVATKCPVPMAEADFSQLPSRLPISSDLVRPPSPEARQQRKKSYAVL